MAGFVIGVSDQADVAAIARSGVYSTRLDVPRRDRFEHFHRATFADYATMRPGDNVYFFAKRLLYGIGELVAIGTPGGDCKFENFPTASTDPSASYHAVRSQLLLDFGESSIENRWLCTFQPSPHFFTRGIDMDDVLVTRPQAFRMLRAWAGLSFVRVDDEENQAIKDAILRENRDMLMGVGSPSDVFEDAHSETHAHIDALLTRAHRLDARDLVHQCTVGTRVRRVTQEVALEAAIIEQLTRRDAGATSIFGVWDFVSRQFTASPPKPPKYIDRMDVFGFSYLQGTGATIDRYHVVELKAGRAHQIDIEQTMKYVDWVTDEFAHGNFDMVNAWLVASSFGADASAAATDLGTRMFTVGRHPARSRVWNRLRLVTYSVGPNGDVTYR